MTPEDLARSVGVHEEMIQAWVAGYQHGAEERQRLQETIRNLIAWNQDEMERWRNVGLTYDAIRQLVTSYVKEDISFGKLVEQIRLVASIEVDRRLQEFSKEKKK
jgi:hypothetical protein